MTGYTVNIKNASRELTARERIKIKDLTNSVELAEVTKGDGHFLFCPVAWAELEIHNDFAEDKDYAKYVLIDAEGTKLATGSESFWTSFLDIWNEMGGQTEEDAWNIDCYGMPSKNYKGNFLTCSIV